VLPVCENAESSQTRLRKKEAPKMTPDIFMSAQHRQRVDQSALRLALVDLAQLLEPALREQWLQALRSRTATARAAALELPADQAAAVLAMATALEYLTRSLATPKTPTTDDAK
jgi:hypothetical protein